MVNTVKPVSKSVFVLIPFTAIFAAVGSPQIPGGRNWFGIFILIAYGRSLDVDLL